MRRRRTFLAALSVSLLLLLLRFMVPASEAPGQSAPPATSPTPRVAEPGPVTQIERVEQQLKVEVRLAATGSWSTRVQAKLPDADDYGLVPGPDADWPDLRSADLLQELLACDGCDGEEAIMAAFLEAADGDGLLAQEPGDLDDAWLGMIALWSHYVGWVQEGSVPLFEQDPDPERWVWLAQEIDAVIAGDPDSEPAQGLLFCLHLVVEAFDVDMDLDEAADMRSLVASDNPALARDALERLLEVDGLHPADLQHLPVPVDAQLAVARAGLAAAVRSGDGAQTEHWLGVLESAADVTEADLADVDEVRGLLAAQGLHVATDWRSELIAATWACHLESRVTGDQTVLFHVERGRWDVLGTDRDGLGACLEGWGPASPSPAWAAVDLVAHGVRVQP
jgi:hypothetical protein